MCRVELLTDVSVIETEDNFSELFIESTKLFFFRTTLYPISSTTINITNNYELIVSLYLEKYRTRA